MINFHPKKELRFNQFQLGKQEVRSEKKRSRNRKGTEKISELKLFKRNKPKSQGNPHLLLPENQLSQ
jgi:hypothetical protein